MSLTSAEGKVTGGAKWVLAGGVDHVLDDGVEGDAPDDVVGGGLIALDVKVL